LPSSSASCATRVWTTSQTSSRRSAARSASSSSCSRSAPLAAICRAYSGWEYAWHYLGPDADKVVAPTNSREALMLGLSFERRSQIFYADVSENSPDESVSALAAEMAAGEQRHVTRLEMLLARELDPAVTTDEAAGVTLA